MKKATVQLSANFLVVILISVFILIFGIVLLTNLLDNSEKVLGEIDEKLEIQIRESLDKNILVSIPLVEFDTSRDELVRVHMGIINQEDEVLHFGVNIEFEKAVLLSGGIAETSASDWRIIGEAVLDSTILIENNIKDVNLIGIDVPKDAWANTEYIFNVYVCSEKEVSPLNSNTCDGNPITELYDGTVHKLYVKVK